MKAKIKVEKEVDIKTLRVSAGVRYWEDASVNGVEDTDGNLIPCRKGEKWEPEIDFETGIIRNWQKGKSASIHYKVCDAGQYSLLDEDDQEVISKDGYVPGTLCPEDNGYGDYIIMEVDENGQIANWQPDVEDFIEKED